VRARARASPDVGTAAGSARLKQKHSSTGTGGSTGAVGKVAGVGSNVGRGGGGGGGGGVGGGASAKPMSGWSKVRSKFVTQRDGASSEDTGRSLMDAIPALFAARFRRSGKPFRFVTGPSGRPGATEAGQESPCPRCANPHAHVPLQRSVFCLLVFRFCTCSLLYWCTCDNPKPYLNRLLFVFVCVLIF